MALFWFGAAAMVLWLALAARGGVRVSRRLSRRLADEQRRGDELALREAMLSAFVRHDAALSWVSDALREVAERTGIETLAVIYDGAIVSRGVGAMERARAGAGLVAGVPSAEVARDIAADMGANTIVLPIRCGDQVAHFVAASRRPGDLLAAPIVHAISAVFALALASVERRRAHAPEPKPELVRTRPSFHTQKLHAAHGR